MFHGILLVAPFRLPRLPGIEDKLSYPDLYCGVPLWKNESQANQTRVASVTIRTVRVPGEFQAKDLGLEEDLSFFFQGTQMHSSLLNVSVFIFINVIHIHDFKSKSFHKAYYGERNCL